MSSRRSSPEDFCRDSKRQKTFHHAPDTSHEPPRNASPRLNENYTVAWICALPIEMTAAEAMLDELHDTLPKLADDNNTYTLGRIHKHNVVIACLPTGYYGTINAATVTSNLKRSFPSIRAGLMVGIGGGVPSKADLRLGDVVVGTRVMQCDMGKIVENGQLQRTAIARIPHQLLGTAVSALRAKQERDSTSITSIVAQKVIGHSGYHRPDLSDDLFPPTYDHEPSNLDCNQCDRTKLVPRRHRSEPAIHYGAIASGNQVMRNALQRDIIGQELDVICFEMEAAGLMDIIPCLPIRGICDYSDSHKNKSWQRYAAATAAAFASGLLAVLPSSEGHESLGFPPRTETGPPDDRCQRLLELLDSDQKDSRQSSIKTAHVKTCRWLLTHADYEAWLNPERLMQHHGFLWIHGKPGAGKSTIMKFAYVNMRKARRKHGTTAAFFFNARGEYIERSVLGMYRSLLLQLFQGLPEVQSVLNDPDFRYLNNSDSISLDNLKQLFTNAVLSLGRRTFTCFIDALDECDEQQILDMVQYFEDLADQATEAGIKFRICFSSRHYPYIVVNKCINVTLEDQQGHAADLENYVTNCLRLHDSRLRSQLHPEILQKASGVFLWVSLVVDILNEQYSRGGMDLRKRLSEIPSDLNELFKNMLRRDEHNRENLLLCMLWILCAKRPLHPGEFSHALWSGLLINGNADYEPPQITDSDGFKLAKIFVIGSSKGLAEVTNTPQPRVQFIHESVRNFLLDSGGLRELWPEIGFDWKFQAHERIKECCNSYLSHAAVKAVGKKLLHPTSASEKDVTEPFPFLKYSVEHILDHANDAEEAISQHKFLAQFCTRTWILFSNYFEKHRTRRYSAGASLLYILADRGLPGLITRWTGSNTQIGALEGKERFRHPLFAALARGNKSAVAALLNVSTTTYGEVDITEGMKHIKDLERFTRRTPLSWACQENRFGIASLLLQNGATVSERDEDGRTACSRAAEMGHETVVRLLINYGASVSETDAEGRTALSRASENGHEGILNVLLEHGSNVNARDSDYRGCTPIFWASTEASVECLIENGADIEITNNVGATPLVHMIQEGNEAGARGLKKRIEAANSSSSAIAT